MSPEFPSEFYDHISGRLKSLGLTEQHINELSAKLNRDTPKEIFDKSLYEYDVLIATFIHTLEGSQ